MTTQGQKQIKSFDNAPTGLEKARKAKNDRVTSVLTRSFKELFDTLRAYDLSKNIPDDPRMSEVKQGVSQVSFTYPPNSNGKEGDSMMNLTNGLLTI
jgi:hypothetical protein